MQTVPFCALQAPPGPGDSADPRIGMAGNLTHVRRSQSSPLSDRHPHGDHVEATFGLIAETVNKICSH